MKITRAKRSYALMTKFLAFFHCSTSCGKESLGVYAVTSTTTKLLPVIKEHAQDVPTMLVEAGKLPVYRAGVLGYNEDKKAWTVMESLPLYTDTKVRYDNKTYTIDASDIIGMTDEDDATELAKNSKTKVDTTRLMKLFSKYQVGNGTIPESVTILGFIEGQDSTTVKVDTKTIIEHDDTIKL